MESKEQKKSINNRPMKSKHLSPCLFGREDSKKNHLPQLVPKEGKEMETKSSLSNSTVKGKPRSFVSRFRANTWSPKQEAPEFDNIGVLHKRSEETEAARRYLQEKDDETTVTYDSLYEPTYTESLYIHRPDQESSVSLLKVRGSKDKNPRFKDLGLGDLNPGEKDSRISSRSPRYDNTYPRIEVTNPICEDIDPKFEETPSKFGEINPRIEDPKFGELSRNSHVGLKNGRPNGRVFLLPHNDCDKKTCSTLSPNCARRLEASSDECLPKVPLGKVNMIQAARVWQKMREEDCPNSRNRSFTQ